MQFHCMTSQSKSAGTRLMWGKSVHSPGFSGAWGEQHVWCGEVFALLQREMGGPLICCCLITVEEGEEGVLPEMWILVKGHIPWERWMSAGWDGQNSHRNTQEVPLSSCIQQHYSQIVPVEVREEANHVFRILCFSECCECKEVVLRLLATYTYNRK